MNSSSRPVLTFGMIAWNQEQFIREAVEAAFAQTYSPLEIILSDDNSDDRTFQLMSELAARYHGPHKVVLNRNPVRRGLGGHVNRVVELSNGELILAAAGDDISLPQRAEVAWEAWEYSGRKATSIHSRIIQIDEAGHQVEDIFKVAENSSGQRFVLQSADLLHYVKTLEPLIFGCTHAFSRKLFATFGNLADEIVHEDSALGLRSLMIGQVLLINEPLVKYRIHANNVYIRSAAAAENLHGLRRQEERIRRGLRNREIMYREFQTDLDIAKQRNLIPAATHEMCVAEAKRLQKKMALNRRFAEGRLFTKLSALWALSRIGLTRQELRVLARRAMPLRLKLLKSAVTNAGFLARSSKKASLIL